MTTDDYERQLAEPFPEASLRSVPKQGRNLTYIPVAEVVTRLNRVLGVGNWGFDADAQRDPLNPDWIIGKVVLRWRMPNWPETQDATMERWQTVTGYGGVQIKYRQGGEPVDLGDEYKGAVSDALKKAAQMLGVGLDLARDEAAVEADTPAYLQQVHRALGKLKGSQLDDLRAWWRSEGMPRISQLTEEQAQVVKNAIDNIYNGSSN